MADWDEIKRLAADFQKVQLTSTSQKLSERNCIEIITYLKTEKIIDLISSIDGKELITPSQLITDIKTELFVHGGRVNLVELARNLNVDLAHINAHLKDVLKGQKDIHSVLGQLIDSNYTAKIAGEINEKLAQNGQINVSDLTIIYDLNTEFLQNQVIERHLGKIIHGSQDQNDPRVYFTDGFVARSKAKIRGALNGLTRPTPITFILNQIGLSDKLFFSLFEQHSMGGVLTSRLVGAQFIPNVYVRSQNEWVTNFYKQNGYIEFDSLIKLGISDYKTFLKKIFPLEEIRFLDSCLISSTILERFEADIDECLNSKTYLDLHSNLPSVFNENDIQMISDLVLTKQKQRQSVIIENYLISRAFIEKLAEKFDESIRISAKTTVDSGSYQQYKTQLVMKPTTDQDDDDKFDKKEERRKKAAGGKSGGGTQGRETKTKSTKKAATRHRTTSSTEEVTRKPLEIIKANDIKSLIENELIEEGLEDLTSQLSDFILPELNEKALKIAEDIYVVTIADRTANRRQTHNELQNKLNVMIGDVRLFDKGLKLLPDDLQTQLVKYLLKTLCTDVANEILSYICTEQNLNVKLDNLNNDQRVKVVGDLPGEYRKALLGLVKSLQGHTIEDFMKTVEEALIACSMILRKIDKKKDRVVILNHKSVLLEQLNKSDDVALVLHLATLVLFISATHSMVHASGRYVAGLLVFLKQFLSETQVNELTTYHDFVTLMLSDGTEAESAREKLKEKMEIVKSIANEFTKVAADKS